VTFGGCSPLAGIRYGNPDAGGTTLLIPSAAQAGRLSALAVCFHLTRF
jgi:hypothetical protein